MSIEPDDIAANLPPPRADEPAMRQDIIDEIADHLRAATRAEQLRNTGTPEEIRAVVLERFGPPAKVAQRLWRDQESKMKRWSLRISIIGLFSIMAGALGYIINIIGTYPTAHSNFIWANVPPQGPYDTKSNFANHADIALIEECNWAMHRSSHYELIISGPQGQDIGKVVFPLSLVGGACDLEREGWLHWAPDGSSVDLRIKAFTYHYDVPKPAAASDYPAHEPQICYSTDDGPH